MVYIDGIQISSAFSLSSPRPLDGKMMLSTDNRKNLTKVQRWLGMIVYDTEDNKWYKLINNPDDDLTVDDDWQVFPENNTISVNVGKEGYTIDDPNDKEHDLQHHPLENSVQIYINGVEQAEGEQFDVDYDNDKVIFKDDIGYVKGDYIHMKYLFS